MKNVRQVPCDLNAEKCLLSSIILDPNVIPEICAHAGGTPPFYSEGHRAFFEIARELRDNGADPDAAMTFTTLNSRGQAALIGGEKGLQNILESTASAVNWSYYLRLVIDAARLRALLDACDSAIFRIGRGRPIDECLSIAADGVARAAMGGGAPKDIHVRDSAALVIADLEAGRPRLIPTGLAVFDQEFGGIPFPGVTTFLGVPGSGKSSLVAGIAMGIAELGMGVRVFSYEMSAESVTANLLAARSERPVNEWLNTGTKPPGRELLQVGKAADDLSALNIAFVEDLLGPRQIEDRCALYKAQGIQCVVVDYLQNLPTDNVGDSDVARIEAGCEPCSGLPDATACASWPCLRWWVRRHVRIGHP